MPKKRTDITKELLEDMYIVKKMTYGEIANEFKASVSTIGVYFKEYDIPIRSRKDRLVHGISQKRVDADKKHSEFMKGRKHGLGHKHTDKTKQRMSVAHRRIYISDDELLMYNMFRKTNQTALAHWSKLVRALLGSICLNCGTIENRLVVHHKNCIVHHPDQAFAVDNGVVLCSSCHAKHHNWLHFTKNTTATKVLFNEWIKEVKHVRL